MKMRAKRLLLFTCTVLLFLPATVHAAKGEVDYLEKMGVLKIKEEIEAPPFTLPDLEGRKVSLSEFQGKFIMLNFCATW